MTVLNLTSREERILLGHGGGGQLTDELIESLVLPRLGNSALNDLLDAAVIDLTDSRLALTIDGYVVQPLQFPGGDIGRLAISGTVNDLSVCGAQPVGIALSLILAEGLERELLEQVLESIRETADQAGVKVVTGDTKVVGRNHADGMYITTAGVGVVPRSRRLHPDQVRSGDVIILTGTIADHGLAVMLAREMPDVQSTLRSDVAPLNGLIAELLRDVPDIAFMRDPTRGGLAAVVADLASRTRLRIVLEETQIPIRPETLHAAEMLGLDPLEVANEGKVVIVVRPQTAPAALNLLRAHPLGRDARIIGSVESEQDGLCELKTSIGGKRILQKPYGEQLPRIC
jgi:hydrogenase expression/formation protein HypE